MSSVQMVGAVLDRAQTRTYALAGAFPAAGDKPGDGYGAAKGQAVAAATVVNLVNGLAWYAIMVCLAAFVLGAAGWALGSLFHHSSIDEQGKRAMGFAILGTVLITAAGTILNFFAAVGGSATAPPVNA